MIRNTVVIGFLAFLAACGEDDSDNQEELVACSATSSVDLAADEDSPLGFGGEELLALTVDLPVGTLVYDNGGSSPLTMTVAARGGAHFEEREWIDEGGNGQELALDPSECAARVVQPVTITFATEDGAFDEVFETELTGGTATSAAWTSTLDLAALGGSFEVDTAGFDEVQAWVDGTFDASGSHGSLSGQGTKTEGSGDDGTVSATNIPLGSW